ncbi:MAG: cyclic nucleotide-binding domain-containing protein [Spirochaetaceae bacterium]|jgi:CRP-like cAMP-binding protein|nr:cyclic nucleotide-binding domain-containing protein [Spirochaetaceae bacterium]
MAEVFTIVKYKQQGIIFRDGDLSDYFYIIRQGYVAINRLVRGLDNPESDNLGPGDLFGIEAVMSSRPHFDNAVAKTECVLIAIRREQYKNLIQSNTAIAQKISMQLSQRIRFLNMQMAATPTQSAGADISTDNESLLYKIGDYYFNVHRYNEAYYTWNKYLQDYPDGTYATMAKMDLAKFTDKVTIRPINYSGDDFIRKYPKGSIICVEGENSSECFIIQKGRIRITKIVNGKEMLLSVVNNGEMFGEMSLLETLPRSATAIALEDCELMTLSKDKFEQTIVTQPQIVIRLTTLLSERIWFLSRQIRVRIMTDLAARCCEMLIVQLERQSVHLNTASHTFDLTPETLGRLCMITGPEIKVTISTLIREGVLVLVDNKVVAKNKYELTRRAKLYWTMHPLK